MAFLTEEQELQKEYGAPVEIGAGSSLLIGRDAAADVVLRDRSVSRRHALLLRAGGAFFVEDLGSTNGTWVGGMRLAPHDPTPLRDGDRLSLGSVDLQLLEGRLMPLAEAPDPACPSRVLVGRGSECDLVLTHPGISRRHCLLEQREDGWWLRDEESANGTLVNGQRCTETRLRDGDEVRLGGHLFRFFDGTLIPTAHRKPIRVDIRGLGQHVMRRGQRQELLQDISFTVLPRELVAVVGASGAGKSTLINALNGLRPASSGEVLYNGTPFYADPEAFRSDIGYVPQDDIIHRELPVASVLRYAARLRLPEGASDEEMEGLIQEVLEELDLGHRRDAVVSTLSGGERKRVNIAVELLTRPSLLLLDEPTSGLDPGLERRIVALLRRLTEEGRTVLFATHATESIAQCDLVLFIARGGRVAFFGSPEEALRFFGVENLTEIYLKLNEEGEETAWPERYRESGYCGRYVVERAAEGSDLERVPRAPARHQPAWKQFQVLAQRYAETIKGDPRNLLILLLQAPVIGLILSFLYDRNTFSADLATKPGSSPPVKDAPELLFLIVIAALWFGTVNSARELTKERPIFMREQLAGVRVWPYLLSKVAILSFHCLAQSSLLLWIVGLRIPLTEDSGTWWLLLAALFLTSMAATLQGLLLSGLSGSTDQAMSLVPLVLIPQVIFSGMLISLADLGPLRAIANLVPARWSYGGLAALTELPDLFAATGIARHTKDVFDTNGLGALLALVLVGLACLVGTAAALTFRSRR